MYLIWDADKKFCVDTIDNKAVAEVVALRTILQGESPMVEEGVNSDDFKKISKLDYKGRAAYVLKMFLTDFPYTIQLRVLFRLRNCSRGRTPKDAQPC